MMTKASFPLLMLSLALGCGDDGGGGEEAVTVSFAALVGSDAAACGTMYPGLGSASADLMITDLRFFVHDVRLLTAEGEVPLTLDDDGMWQNGTVALIDFENGCGDMGTDPTNTSLSGTAPAGDYSGVVFKVGVPESLNHNDPTLAPPPLNLTAMHWNWLGGYKHVRIEGPSSAFDSWRLHLGATMCEGDMMGNATCANQNTPEIRLEGFDPTAGEVTLDIAALVEGSALDNTPETPPGCMSRPDDMDCAPIFGNLGLPFGGASAGTQRVFGSR